jgi:hypothetical protein
MISKIEKYSIPVVRTFDSHDNIESFIEYTRGLSDTEGFVIRFDDGHMAKMKCDWYCLLHKTLEHLYFEKDVLRLILEDKIDDVKAILPNDMIDKIDNFARDVYKGLKEELEFIRGDAMNQWSLSNGNRKTFAERTDGAKGRQFWFKALDYILQWEANPTFNWHDAFDDYALKYVISQTGSQSKVDDIRWLIGGAKWDV